MGFKLRLSTFWNASNAISWQFVHILRGWLIRTTSLFVCEQEDLTIFCFCFYCNTKTQSSTVAERAQRAANRKNTCKTHTLQMLTTQPKKKRAANKMYLVVL